jgi:hypothetical protein
MKLPFILTFFIVNFSYASNEIGPCSKIANFIVGHQDNSLSNQLYIFALNSAKDGFIRLPFLYRPKEALLRTKINLSAQLGELHESFTKAHDPVLVMKILALIENPQLQNGIEVRTFLRDTLNSESKARPPNKSLEEHYLENLILVGVNNNLFLSAFNDKEDLNLLETVYREIQNSRRNVQASSLKYSANPTPNRTTEEISNVILLSEKLNLFLFENKKITGELKWPNIRSKNIEEHNLALEINNTRSDLRHHLLVDLAPMHIPFVQENLNLPR